MAVRAAQTPTSTGVTPTYHPATSTGDKVSPGVLLIVKNGSAASINVTLVTAQVVDGDLAVADRVNAVAAGAERIIRVPNSTVYTNVDNQVDITWSAVTTVTFAVVT